MTPKKVKDENLTPVEETTTEEVTPTPVEEPAPVESEAPAENLDEIPANEPVHIVWYESMWEWIPQIVYSDWTKRDIQKWEKIPFTDIIYDEEDALVSDETPVEEKPAEAPKGGKVEIKEEELKTINLLTAPEEIKKIVEFYGVTSKDLFDKDLKKFWMKKEEEKALKEWYATLA